MSWEIELIGLNGGNLLAYLGALGVLRTLSSGQPPAAVRLRWRERRFWTPVVHTEAWRTPDEVLAVLTQSVAGKTTANSALAIGDDLNLPRAVFRAHLEASAVAASPGSRAEVDFLAALGSDAFAAPGARDAMADTEFRTMSGAGRQHFLASMRELAGSVTAGQLRRALFAPWDYEDGRPSLRWDPADYRPHALRARDPATDPIRTMRGANRLAVEALPWFPTVPEQWRLRTLGFRSAGRGVDFTWPIWTSPLGPDAVRSLLALAELHSPSPSAASLRARGVAQVYRAKRFTDGKYRNFSPARELL